MTIAGTPPGPSIKQGNPWPVHNAVTDDSRRNIRYDHRRRSAWEIRDRQSRHSDRQTDHDDG